MPHFFYSNENFPLPVVIALREFGHDIITSHETGKANQKIPDIEVLEYAQSLNRAVLTLNRRDFIHLHRNNINHSGIVVCTVDVDYPAPASRIHLSTNELDTLKGLLIRINRPD